MTLLLTSAGRADIGAPAAPPEPITFVGVGAVAVADNANVIPELPAGTQAGDLLLCLVAGGPNASGVALVSGWNNLAFNSSVQGSRARLAYKVAAGGDAAPTASAGSGGADGDTVIAQCAAFRGTHAVPQDAPTSHAGSAVDAQNIGPIPSHTPTVSNALIVVAAMKTAAWTSVDPLTGDGLTWAEIAEPSSTVGNDRSIVWNYAVIDGSPVVITAKTFTVTGGAIADWSGGTTSFKPA